jgi:hypothetical protein
LRGRIARGRPFRGRPSRVRVWPNRERDGRCALVVARGLRCALGGLGPLGPMHTRCTANTFDTFGSFDYRSLRRVLVAQQERRAVSPRAIHACSAHELAGDDCGAIVGPVSGASALGGNARDPGTYLHVPTLDSLRKDMMSRDLAATIGDIMQAVGSLARASPHPRLMSWRCHSSP